MTEQRGAQRLTLSSTFEIYIHQSSVIGSQTHTHTNSMFSSARISIFCSYLFVFAQQTMCALLQRIKRLCTKLRLIDVNVPQTAGTGSIECRTRIQ